MAQTDVFTAVFGQSRAANPERDAAEAALAALRNPGSLVRFRYNPEDWIWLPDTAGPLGHYVRLDGPVQADGELAHVLGPHSLTGRGASRGPWVLLRLVRPLGWSMYEEYDDEELAAEGWTQADWPTDLPAPVSALAMP